MSYSSSVDTRTSDVCVTPSAVKFTMNDGSESKTKKKKRRCVGFGDPGEDKENEAPPSSGT